MPVWKRPLPQLTPAEIERFRSCVDRSGCFQGRYYEYQGTPCYVWTGPISTTGYAVFNRMVSATKHEEYRASRIAYKLHHGTDPGQNQACHHCDNRFCVRVPEHIFEGDEAGKRNMEDMSNKRRTRSGNPIYQLSDTDIETIRIQVAEGRIRTQIAKERKMPTSSITRIASGRFYPLAPGPLTDPDPNWMDGNRKIAESSIPEIWHLFLDEKISKTAIGEQFKVTDAAIRSVLRGQEHRQASIKYLAAQNLTLEEGVALAYQTRIRSRKDRRVY